jgi:hypothetical protein
MMSRHHHRLLDRHWTRGVEGHGRRKGEFVGGEEGELCDERSGGDEGVDGRGSRCPERSGSSGDAVNIAVKLSKAAERRERANDLVTAGKEG